jgi:lipopolysaccharide export system protein LptC
LKKPITGLLPLALMVLLAAITFWLEQAVQPPIAGEGALKRHDPDLMIENFTTVRHSAQGAPAYSLTAKKMVHYPDNDLTYLEAPRIASFSPDSPPTRITANEAELSKSGDEAFFYGNVIVVRDASVDQPELRVTTDRLRIDQKKDTAHTDDPVVIVQGNSVLKGVGMDANRKERTFFLRSQTRGTFVRQN